MTAPASITITPVFVADLSSRASGSGLRARHRPSRCARAGRHRHDGAAPAMADMDPRLQPLSEQNFDLAGIDIVVNTHLHADHCGGNHLFAGKPIYVQRRELDDARSEALHHSRVGRGARRAVRAGRRRARAASRAPTRPGAGPHTRFADGRLETGGRPVIVGGDWRCGSASSTSRPPKAGSGSLRSTPSWSGSRTSASHGDPAPSEASRRALFSESSSEVQRGVLS